MGEVGSFCEGKEGAESFDFAMEHDGWSVLQDGDTHRMQQKREGDIAAADGPAKGDLMANFAHRDSMKQACVLTVSEFQSELSEFLFVQLRRKGGVSNATVSDKLCFELSGACLRTSKGDGRRKRSKDL